MLNLFVKALVFMCFVIGASQKAYPQNLDFNVLVTDRQNKPKRIGAGIIIDNKGHLVTSSAVVSTKNKMFVRFLNDDRVYTATLDRIDDKLGLALLSIEDKTIETIATFSNRKAGAGSIVTTTHLAPDGSKFTTKGSVSQILLRPTGLNFYKHNAKFKNNAYGGALVNECGEILGLNIVDPFLTKRQARRLPELEDTFFAISEVNIKEFLSISNIQPSVAEKNCLSAVERATQAEQDVEQKSDAIKKGRQEYEKVVTALDAKEKQAEEAKERAKIAEADAEKTQKALERIRRDSTATKKSKEEAEEAAKKTREEAERAAIDAAAYAAEIKKLQEERLSLEAAFAKKKKRQMYVWGGVGLLFLVFLVLVMAILRKRNAQILAEKEGKAVAEAKLAETFADIECRGADDMGVAHAFNVTGAALLRAPQGVIVGRQPQTAAILLNHPEVSRAHLKFTLTNNQVFVEDLGTTNGSSVNGVRLVAHKVARLTNGDTLTIGKITFKVTFVGA